MRSVMKIRVQVCSNQYPIRVQSGRMAKRRSSCDILIEWNSSSRRPITWHGQHVTARRGQPATRTWTRFELLDLRPQQQLHGTGPLHQEVCTWRIKYVLKLHSGGYRQTFPIWAPIFSLLTYLIWPGSTASLAQRYRITHTLQISPH